jgi:hypothetical protein
MFTTSHPRPEPQLDPERQTRAQQHFQLKHPKDSKSHSGSSSFFHNTTTHFPDLNASRE